MSDTLSLRIDIYPSKVLVKSCLGLPAPSSQAEVSGWAMVVNLNKQLQADELSRASYCPRQDRGGKLQAAQGEIQAALARMAELNRLLQPAQGHLQIARTMGQRGISFAARFMPKSWGVGTCPS